MALSRALGSMLDTCRSPTACACALEAFDPLLRAQLPPRGNCIRTAASSTNKIVSLASVHHWFGRSIHPKSSAAYGLDTLSNSGLCIPYFEEITTPWLLIISERIATYSYGIYLSHQFAIWIALGLFASHPVWVRLPLLIGLFIGFPILLYHVIERPMIRAGVQLATNWHADRRLMSADAPATA